MTFAILLPCRNMSLLLRLGLVSTKVWRLPSLSRGFILQGKKLTCLLHHLHHLLTSTSPRCGHYHHRTLQHSWDFQVRLREPFAYRSKVSSRVHYWGKEFSVIYFSLLFCFLWFACPTSLTTGPWQFGWDNALFKCRMLLLNFWHLATLARTH